MSALFRAAAILTLAIGAMPFAAPFQAVGPPLMPYEDAGACPFEGCMYGAWRATNPVSVRRDRAPDAPIVFMVATGEFVTATTGVVMTAEPGRVLFREPAGLVTGSGTLHVESGDMLYLLTYQGEGVTKAWFHGRLYEDLDGSTAFFNDACKMDPARCAGTVVAEPRQTWWVQVTNMKGQTGWTSQPDRFDGKDALGGNGQDVVSFARDAAVKALTFQAADGASLADGRPFFTDDAWAQFLKTMDGWLDPGGAATFSSTFVPSGDGRVVDEQPDIVHVRVPGTVTQSQHQSKTTYRVAVDVWVRQGAMLVDRMTQTTCVGQSTACR